MWLEQVAWSCHVCRDTAAEICAHCRMHMAAVAGIPRVREANTSCGV